MAVNFVLEDGTGKADANSYASVAEADTYFTDRGNTSWAALSSDAKKSCLIKATDYVDQRFSDRFIGSLAVSTQALAWPRIATGQPLLDYDTDTELGVVPTKLKYACIEYALRANDSPLAPDLAFDDSGVAMVTTKEQIGPITVDKQRASGNSNASSINTVRPYPSADMYLKTLLLPGSMRTYR